MIKARDYWVGYLIPLSLVFGYWFHGVFYWFPVILAFGILPLADYIIGADSLNPDPDNETLLRQNDHFDWPLYAFALVQALAVFGGAYHFAEATLSIHERIGLVISTGVITGGLGITIAHELCHRTSKVARATGFYLLTLVSYTHFGIEHVSGHHRRVATPEDPTTARFGENVYRFLVRSIVGSFLSVCSFEVKRLGKKGLPAWHFRNRMYACTLLPLLIAGALFYVWGPWAALFFLAQSFVAIVLLEITNFVEHYGLLRKKRPTGQWEKITPAHSWNANQRLSNLTLFKLQRHADHHAHATRPYQILRHFDDSPQLPFGYPTMILIALIPALWRRVMDPRVRAIRALES